MALFGLDKLFRGFRTKKYGGRYEQLTQLPPDMSTAELVKSYGEIGWLYACVTKRAEAVASADLHLYRLDSESNQVELFDHPLLKLLEKPNPFTTGYKLDMLTGIFMDLAGEAFWIVERDNRGRPIELWSVNPAYMWVCPDRETFVRGWVYRCGSDNIPIDPADIIHFFFPNPDNPYRGLGPAQAASVDLQSSKYSKEWNRRFFYNSARPDAVIEFDRVLDEDEYDAIVKAWNASHSGVGNAHKIGMLEIGHYKQISTNPKDMDFGNLQTQTRDAILSIFGVPKSVLGITEDVNRATAETAEYTFAKRTVKSLLRMRQDDLNAQLVPLFPEERLFLGYDDPTPEDQAAKLAAWTAGHNKWLTTNEIREQLGLEPVEGGDEIPQPGSGAMPSFGFDDLTDDDQGDGGKSIPQRHTRLPMVPKSKALVIRKRQVAVWLKGLDREAYWKSFVTKTDKREQQLARTWRAIFREQAKNIDAALDDYHKTVRVSDSLLTKMRALSDKKADKSEMDQLLASLDKVGKDSPTFKSLRPMIARMLSDSAQEFFDDTGMGIEFDLRNPKVSKWIDRYCLAQIRDINHTTREAVRHDLLYADENGLSLPEIKDMVMATFKDAEESRVNTIVRTEVIGSSNAGTLAGYEQSGVVQGKEWLAAIDERTRESHMAADGQRVELDEDFVLDDGAHGECPGNIGEAEHDCNCRCTVLPVV